MNAIQETPVCCPRCQSAAATIVLGRDGDAILFECHACLSLQVARLPQGDLQQEAETLSRGRSRSASGVLR